MASLLLPGRRLGTVVPLSSMQHPRSCAAPRPGALAYQRGWEGAGIGLLLPPPRAHHLSPSQVRTARSSLLGAISPYLGDQLVQNDSEAIDVGFLCARLPH